MKKDAMEIVNVRLKTRQIKAIKAITDRCPILDQSKYIRLAVDHLLKVDLGKVLASSF